MSVKCCLPRIYWLEDYDKTTTRTRMFLTHPGNRFNKNTTVKHGNTHNKWVKYKHTHVKVTHCYLGLHFLIRNHFIRNLSPSRKNRPKKGKKKLSSKPSRETFGALIHTLYDIIASMFLSPISVAKVTRCNFCLWPTYQFDLVPMKKATQGGLVFKRPERNPRQLNVRTQLKFAFPLTSGLAVMEK